MKRALATAVLTVWIGVVTALSGQLLVRHLAPLPPSPAPLLASGLQTIRGPSSRRVVVFHVLLANCRCSRQVAHALMRTPRPIDVEEHVLLVDDTSGELASQLADRPFVLHTVKSSELEMKFGISGAPLLVIAGRDDLIRYSGGYTDRKQGLVVRDRELIDAVSRGEQPTPLPLFGCATSERARAERNIWGLP